MGARPTIRVVSAEIEQDGCYLLTQRGANAVLPLLWEFPGGRVRRGESDAEAIVRCLSHRLGVEVLPGLRVQEVWHDYPEYRVLLCVYQCTIVAGEPIPRSVQALAWVAPEDFGNYEFPGADQKTVDLLLQDS